MSALAVKSKSISENEVGMGQTTSWRVCSLSGDTSIAVYYEIVNQHSNPIPAGTPFYLQFCVRYKRSNGEIRLRVMTVARRWAESAAAHDIVSGFDQEACALLMARVSTFRVEHEETFDLLRWLDRTLIRVGSKFGEYAKDSPETFRMPGPFAIYPQFMFNLRRSQFLQTANNTPDETAFYRLMMGRETVLNSLVMIQPTLTAYTFTGEPTPVLLDVASIQPDCILLLDTFFMIVVHSGSTIGEWRKAGYQELPEHEAFRTLLAKPYVSGLSQIQAHCFKPISDCATAVTFTSTGNSHTSGQSALFAYTVHPYSRLTLFLYTHSKPVGDARYERRARGGHGRFRRKRPSRRRDHLHG
jgi:protein transport protein SEC23